jgi:hypothetical protein
MCRVPDISGENRLFLITEPPASNLHFGRLEFDARMRAMARWEDDYRVALAAAPHFWKQAR